MYGFFNQFFSEMINATLFRHLSVVLPPDGIPDVKWSKIPSPEAYGGFELLLDEELAAQGDSGAGLVSNSSGGGSGGGGAGRKGNTRGSSGWKVNQI